MNIGEYTVTKQINDKSWEAVKTRYDEKGQPETLKYVIKKLNSREMDIFVKLIELSKITLSRVYMSVIVDVIDDGENTYSVSEFVEGESLQNIIKSRDLHFSEVLKYMSDLAESVDYIHRNGISHGNIKPSNIILNDGRLRLIDFNTACSKLSDCSYRGEIYYSPPEYNTSVTDFKDEKRHDMWSVGVVYYQLANSGENYIDFTSVDPDVIMKDIKLLPVKASKNVYQPINIIISSLLNKDVTARINCVELVADIQLARPYCEIDDNRYSRSEGLAILVSLGMESEIVNNLDSEICRELTSEIKKCELRGNLYVKKQLEKLADLLGIEYDDMSGKNLCILIAKELDLSNIYSVRATGDLINLLDILSEVSGSLLENMKNIYNERYGLYKENRLIDVYMLKEIQADVYSSYLAYKENGLTRFQKQAAYKNNEIVKMLLDFQPEIQEYQKFLV